MWNMRWRIRNLRARSRPISRSSRRTSSPMFDPKSLLDQFLGGSAGGSLRNAGKSVKDQLDRQSGSGGFVRGAAAGGLLGLLLGGKGLKGVAGGVLGYG